MAIDPIHQFKIEPLFTIGHIGRHAIAFTDSSLYMLVTVALIAPLMIGGVAGRRLVPGRFQPVAEISCEFVARTALELLVAFLQAYFFAMLACIYLRDAIHPGH